MEHLEAEPLVIQPTALLQYQIPFPRSKGYVLQRCYKLANETRLSAFKHCAHGEVFFFKVTFTVVGL